MLNFMANTKKIAVCIVAVILVAGVTISFSSYLSEFNNPPNSSQDDVKAVTFKNPPVLGSATATVTIVEVGDYQCEMCKLWFEQTRPQIIKNYVDTGKVNLTFVDMPFLGSDSIPASEASYCADDQGKYWEYHSMLFTYQEDKIDGCLLYTSDAADE